jgi:hypothetical protein
MGFCSRSTFRVASVQRLLLARSCRIIGFIVSLCPCFGKVLQARVAELADALVLEASAARRVGSSPSSRTDRVFAEVAELADAPDSKSGEA